MLYDFYLHLNNDKLRNILEIDIASLTLFEKSDYYYFIHMNLLEKMVEYFGDVSVARLKENDIYFIGFRFLNGEKEIFICIDTVHPYIPEKDNLTSYYN